MPAGSEVPVPRVSAVACCKELCNEGQKAACQLSVHHLFKRVEICQSTGSAKELASQSPACPKLSDYIMYIYFKVTLISFLIAFLYFRTHSYYNHIKINSLHVILLYASISRNTLIAYNKGYLYFIPGKLVQ
jgi:hypothetical protein